MKLSYLASAFVCFVAVASGAVDLEDGFEKVTCGSTIKLTHQPSGFKLHSHGVSYGSGSGQQSITAFPEADDGNSFWLVRASLGKQCKRGEPVPCGSTIRLRHANTKNYLHSHLHSSPLSRQQEVSCFDGEDTGDDWKVECSSGKYWTREAPIQLLHTESKAYLSSSTNHQYGQPIPGQLEVAAAKSSSKSTYWIAQEGIYFAENTK